MSVFLKLFCASLQRGSFLVFVLLFSALLLYQPVTAQPDPCEWKFYLAFEDATGARDTLWLIWHPENTPVDDDPAFGEISLPVSVIDTGQFVLWFDGNFLKSGRRIYAPAYCWAGIAIHASNYELPITVSWDTTFFQSPSLTAPECVGIGWNTYGAGVTNGQLGNEYIYDYGYGLPSPPFPWYGVIMFLTSIELVEVPMWPWFNNFPLGFDLKCGDPNETPWSTRNLRGVPELSVFPNPASNDLQVQAAAPWHHAVV